MSARHHLGYPQGAAPAKIRRKVSDGHATCADSSTCSSGITARSINPDDGANATISDCDSCIMAASHEAAMVNPFFVYIIAFGGTLLAYGLHWSTIYPPLSSDLVSFFLLTFLASIPLALIVWPHLLRVRRKPSGLPRWMTLSMVLGMAADIAYAGGIPLFMVSQGSDFDYSQFGIPTFHVILATFSSAYAAVRFSDFVLTRRGHHLVAAMIPPAFSILTFTRGTAMMSLIAFAFIWLGHHGMPRLRSIVVGLSLGLSALYVFGVLGDIRSPGAIEDGRPAFQGIPALCSAHAISVDLHLRHITAGKPAEHGGCWWAP